MFLDELPAVLVEDIIVEAACDMELFETCQLREVNRELGLIEVIVSADHPGFFEMVATRIIADDWIYKLTSEQAQNIPEAFRKRLIKLYVGDQDRGENGKKSALRRLVHEVAQHLAQYTNTRTQEQWLQLLIEGLNRCKLCDSRNDPLNTGGWWSEGDKWNDSRLTGGRSGDEKIVHSQIDAASFMFAILTEDEALQNKLISDGHELDEVCHFLWSPLELACRLGLHSTVSRLLQAGVEDESVEDDENGYGPQALFLAVQAGQVEVVKLLLKYDAHEDQDDKSLHHAALMAYRKKNREILEHILTINPRRGAFAAIKAAASNGWDDMLEPLLVPETYLPQHYWTSDEIGTPLVHAAEGGHLTTCQLILSKSTHDIEDSSNLLRATAFGGNVRVLDFLLNEKFQTNEPNHLPVAAAMKGHLEMLQYVLDHGYHLRRKKSHELMRYALLAAIYNQHCDVVNLLVLRLNIDLDSLRVEESDENSWHIHDSNRVVVPLIAAVDSGSSDMVRLLIRLGASVDMVKWDSTSFSKHHRKCRHIVVGRFNTRRLKLSRRYSRWEYSVRQRDVDEALRVVVDYDNRL
jgi:ankyrin repeat protein